MDCRTSCSYFSRDWNSNTIYKGRKLRCEFQPDFICYNQVILELNAVKELANEHRSQVNNFLNATGHRVGLLVNFGHHPGVEIERIARWI